MKILTRCNSSGKRKSSAIVLFGLSFAVIGLLSVLYTFAATAPTAKVQEAEGAVRQNTEVLNDVTASGGSYLEFKGSANPPSTTVCNLNATPSNFSTQISALSPGQTVCLNDGNYGTWAGTNKAITISAVAGASPVMEVDFNTGDNSFTLNGLVINGGSIVNGAKDITIKNATFTYSLIIDNVANSNILIDSSTFNNQSTNSTCTQDPARIHLAYTSSTPSGVTIQNSTFNGGNKDGIQTGTAVTIKNNVFSNIRENGPNDCQHTDPIQGVGATGVIVIGNLLFNNADGIVEFEQSTNWVVTDNACYAIDRGACITLYSDRNSTVEYNTAKGVDVLELDRKSANRAGSGTVFRNNVGSLSAGNGSATGVNTNNLFSGANAPNISGTPLFIGGSNPTTRDGFKLAQNSPGINGSTSGGSIGVR